MRLEEHQTEALFDPFYSFIDFYFNLLPITQPLSTTNYNIYYRYSTIIRIKSQEEQILSLLSLDRGSIISPEDF